MQLGMYLNIFSICNDWPGCRLVVLQIEILSLALYKTYVTGPYRTYDRKFQTCRNYRFFGLWVICIDPIEKEVTFNLNDKQLFAPACGRFCLVLK